MKRKVLMLRSSAGVFGAETVILELAKGLKDGNFEPIIGVLENQDSAWSDLVSAAQVVGCKCIAFRCRKQVDYDTIFEIRHSLRKQNIDIIHAHGYKANFYALMSSAFTKVVRVATCHPWTETDYSWKARFYTFCDKLWLRRMSHVVAISEEIRKSLAKRLRQSKVSLIANGVDLNRFVTDSRASDNLRQELGLQSTDKVLITVGRLVPEKGYTFLLDAVKKLNDKYPDLKLLFAGDGMLRKDLEASIVQKELVKTVIFLGTRKDIPALLAMADAFVIASTSEGLPMVLLEAMAAGKPIVSTRVGYIANVVSHEVSALLVDPGDATDLADALNRIFSEPETAARLALAARTRVMQDFSLEKMTESYETIYRKLLLMQQLRN